MKKQKFAQMEVNSSGIRVKGYFNLIKSYVYLLFFSVKMIPHKICCCNVDFICPQSLWNCCILIYYVFMFVQAEHTQNKPVLVVLFVPIYVAGIFFTMWKSVNTNCCILIIKHVKCLGWEQLSLSSGWKVENQIFEAEFLLVGVDIIS